MSKLNLKEVVLTFFQLVHIKCKVTGLCNVLLFSEEAVFFCGGGGISGSPFPQ